MYKGPNTPDPEKERKLGIFEDQLNSKPGLGDRLKKMEVGKQYCAHVQKNAKGFYELVDVSDAADADAPKAKTSGGGWKGRPRNEAGQQAGNVMKIAADTLGKCDINQLRDWCYQVLDLSNEIKAAAEAKTSGKPTTTKTTEEWGGATTEAKPAEAWGNADDELKGMDW